MYGILGGKGREGVGRNHFVTEEPHTEFLDGRKWVAIVRDGDSTVHLVKHSTTTSFHRIRNRR